ncbi:hypothetical protein AB0870_09890 [Microbacterium proteolyticum]
MEVGWWALIVSAGSLAVSGATFWRNRTPKPKWVREVTVTTGDDGNRRVQAFATNRGRGVARDAALEANVPGPMRLFSRDSAVRREFGEHLQVTIYYGPEVHGQGSFLLTWSQEPHLHRQRKRRMKFRLNAVHVEDADAHGNSV